MDEGLDLSALSGSVVETLSKIAIEIETREDDQLSASFDQVVEQWGEIVAQRWVEAEAVEAIPLESQNWENEPKPVPYPFVLLAEEIDLDEGTLSVEILPKSFHLEWPFLDDEELLQYVHEGSQLYIDLKELHVPLSKIEMLAPAASAPLTGTITKAEPRQSRGGPGRVPIWDWPGAFAHVAAVANGNDGLPRGHGAQAAIAKLMAEWFSLRIGSEPSATELKRRANEVLTAIDDQVREKDGKA